LRALNYQDLLDLVDGAAIFSAGGGGDPEVGYRIADKLASQGLELWKDALQRSNIFEEYIAIEKLASYTRR